MNLKTIDLVAGNPEIAVIIHVPHAGLGVPLGFRDQFLLGPEELAAEMRTMADVATDGLALDAFHSLEAQPWLFINKLSRLVFDPERFPDETEEMNSVGMGVVYTKTSDQRDLRDPNKFEAEEIVKQLFEPYAKTLRDLTSELLSKHGTVTIVDLHSFSPDPLPYELHKEGERPSVCLGVDEYHTSPHLLEKARTSFECLGTIAINTPFAGTYVPLDFYKADIRVQSIMLEIRKDTYGWGDRESPAFKETAKAIANFIRSI